MASMKMFLRRPGGAAPLFLALLQVATPLVPAGAACAGVAAAVAVPVGQSFAAMAILQDVRFGSSPQAQRTVHKFQSARTGLFSFHTSPLAIRQFLGPTGIRQVHQKGSAHSAKPLIGRTNSLSSFTFRLWKAVTLSALYSYRKATNRYMRWAHLASGL